MNGQQVHKKVLNITNIKEMKIKSIMKYHVTPVRIAIIKKTRVTSVSEDVEKRKPLCTVGGL